MFKFFIQRQWMHWSILGTLIILFSTTTDLSLLFELQPMMKNEMKSNFFMFSKGP